jgi:hypothetical protein
MYVRVLFELRNGLLFFAILRIFAQNILRFYAYLPKNILRFQRNAAFVNKLERNKLLRRQNNLFRKYVKTLRFLRYLARYSVNLFQF